jgi:hypothetical protein
MQITPLILKQQGFIPTTLKNIYSKRVHELIFLEFDMNDCFITIVRMLEIPKARRDNICDRHKIVFPQKIDTISKLNQVVAVFTGNW